MSVFIVSIQAAVPWDQRGAATSSNMFMRFMGQVMGVSGCGAVLNATILRMDPGAARAMDRMLNPLSRAALPPAGDRAPDRCRHQRAAQRLAAGRLVRPAGVAVRLSDAGPAQPSITRSHAN